MIQKTTLFQKILAVGFLAASGTFLSGASAATSEEADNSPPQALNQHLGASTHFVRKMRAFWHWDPEKYMPIVADMGLGWVRDEIIWSWMEKEKGVYKLPAKDIQWLDLAKKHGIKVIVTLSASNPLYEDRYDADGYAQASAYLAKEYGDRIQAIEVLNEPFHWYAKTYGEGTTQGGDLYGLNEDGEPESWLRRYVKLLNTTAEAVKAVNPDMKIIGLGSFPAMNMRMIEMGISSDVDGVVLHPYSYRIVPEVVPYVASKENYIRNGGRQTADEDGTFASLIRYSEAFSAKHHGPPETWLTEWGFTTKRDGAGARSNFTGMTEEAQASYIQRRMLECLGLGVEVSTVYTLVDSQMSWRKPDSQEFVGEDNWGLIKADGTFKPSYYAVKRLARATAGFVISDAVEFTMEKTTERARGWPFEARDGTVLYAPDRIATYQFKNAEGEPVIAFWSMERISDQPPRPADLEINVDPERVGFEATDLLTGRVYEPAATEKDGKLFFKNIAVPTHPVLLRLYQK